MSYIHPQLLDSSYEGRTKGVMYGSCVTMTCVDQLRRRARWASIWLCFYWLLALPGIIGHSAGNKLNSALTCQAVVTTHPKRNSWNLQKWKRNNNGTALNDHEMATRCFLPSLVLFLCLGKSDCWCASNYGSTHFKVWYCSDWESQWHTEAARLVHVYNVNIGKLMFNYRMIAVFSSQTYSRNTHTHDHNNELHNNHELK